MLKEVSLNKTPLMKIKLRPIQQLNGHRHLQLTMETPPPPLKGCPHHTYEVDFISLFLLLCLT